MTSSSNLFDIIQVTHDDIKFWTFQLTEHALFLHLLLNPQAVPELKNEAKHLHNAWNEHRQKCKDLNPKKCSCIPDGYIGFLKLSNALYALLETIHSKIGVIPNINLDIPSDDFHALIRHMLMEQTYFVRLVEGKITMKEELLFWLQENAEHMTLISHLLPFGPLKDQAANIADILGRTKDAALQNSGYFINEVTLIRAANESAMNVHNAIVSGQVLTINQIMLDHEIREAIKGEERVRYLLSVLK